MSEYERMMRAVNKGKLKLSKNNYHETFPACCGTCEHHRQMSVEDEMTCSLITHPDYIISSVDIFGKCDKYLVLQISEVPHDN